MTLGNVINHYTKKYTSTEKQRLVSQCTFCITRSKQIKSTITLQEWSDIWIYRTSVAV